MAELFDTGRKDSKADPAGGYAVVAIERGLDAAGAGLTYAVPDSLTRVSVGDRVVVPLGRGDKRVSGYVVELSDTSAFTGGRVKRILERAPGVSLPPDLIDLARWISGYYCCPLGMVFGSMMPASVKHGTGLVQRQVVRFARDLGEDEKIPKLQRAALAVAKNDAGWINVKTLADLAGAKTVGPVKQLIDRGLLETKQHASVESDLDLSAQQELEPTGRIALNKSQHDAVEHLTKHLNEGFGVHLLHGVTGSGKTEVYLRLIEAVLGAGIGVRVSGIGG